MLGRLYEGQDCSAARALELVGERWTLLILRDALFRGYTRFSQFRSSLDIAPNILSKRLNDMVGSGLLEREPQASRPDSFCYEPTDMARDLLPVIIALTKWGDRWVRPGPARLVHGDRDHEIELRLWCATCRATVGSAEAHAVRRH